MTTPKVSAPELSVSQASKEATVNEAIRRAESGAAHYLVIDKDLTAPPGSCADGACYIVASGATGAWAGHVGEIAIAVGANASNGWYFRIPEEGVFAWVQDETPPLHYWDNSSSPGSWQDYANGVIGALALDDLTDVQVPASPTDGYVLTYDTDSPVGWKALPPASPSLTLDGLSDVDTTGVADGDLLMFESSPAGWRAQGPAAVRAVLDVYTQAEVDALIGDIYPFGITLDGGGSDITTGVKGFVQIPRAGTIVRATLLSTDASATAGSIVIDVWKDTYANYPPTNADSITAAAPPTLSSANKSTDTTLTGWTTSVSGQDVVGFNVDSCTGVTRCTLIIEVQT